LKLHVSGEEKFQYFHISPMSKQRFYIILPTVLTLLNFLIYTV
jgi:hypothetical protein